MKNIIFFIFVIFIMFYSCIDDDLFNKKIEIQFDSTVKELGGGNSWRIKELIHNNIKYTLYVEYKYMNGVSVVVLEKEKLND